MARVTVIGATGGVGAHVTRLAAQAGHTVVAAARRPEAVLMGAGVIPVRCDVRERESVRDAVAGAEVVLSCLGNDRGRSQVTWQGTCNVLEGARSARRVVAISSVGVGDSFDQCRRMSWVFARLIAPVLLRRPFADLARMEGAMARHSQTTVIVRPVGLTSGPETGRAIGHEVSADVPMRVSRADVAAFMVGLVEDARWDNKAVTVATPLAPV